MYSPSTANSAEHIIVKQTTFI